MVRWVLRAAIALLVIQTGRPVAAGAPEYRYFQLQSLPYPLPAVDVSLNDRGELAWVQTGPFGKDLWFDPKSGRQLLLSTSAAGSVITDIRLRRLIDSGTILYSVDYVAADPRLGSVNTWNALTGPLEIFAKPKGAGAVLDAFPDINEAGQIAFLEANGGYFISRWTGTMLERGLSGCEFIGDARPSEDGTLVWECRFFQPVTQSGILRGQPGAWESFVHAGIFPPSGDVSLFIPLDTNVAGTVLFSKSGTPAGFYTKTPGGVPELMTSTNCIDAELNDLGQVMCHHTTDLEIVSPPVPHYVVLQEPLGTRIGHPVTGPTVVSLGPSASLNDLGQIAFTANLSNNTAGVFIATPTTCDTDTDGWCNVQDNCPSYLDRSQLDTDHDGLGDRCDNCPFHANPAQTDSNADGRGDACAPCSATGLPRCGTRTKGAGTEVITITDVPMASLPARPGVYSLAKWISGPVVVDASIVGCSGGIFTVNGSPVGNFDGDGFDLRRLFESYELAAHRQDAFCTFEFRASGAGTYTYLVDSATVTPEFETSWTSSLGETIFDIAVMPDALEFTTESHNHRFLYSGTGGANFGTCTWSPDPPGDDPQVAYSGAPGTGWDCCTFQFDGVDEVPSAVGQLVVNLNGAPPPPPDPDHDGFLSACDSCDYVHNVDQKDSGRVGGATPDGVGNVCQCGELTADGLVNASDATRLRQHLAGIGPVLGADALARCSVIGAASECTVRTVSVLRRALASPLPLGPGVQQTCTPALP